MQALSPWLLLAHEMRPEEDVPVMRSFFPMMRHEPERNQLGFHIPESICRPVSEKRDFQKCQGDLGAPIPLAFNAPKSARPTGKCLSQETLLCELSKCATEPRRPSPRLPFIITFQDL